MKRLFIIICLFLVGCGGVPIDQAPVTTDIQRYSGMYDNTKVIIENGKETALRRVIDSEAGVVCYSFMSSGVYCMPLSETTIKR